VRTRVESADETRAEVQISVTMASTIRLRYVRVDVYRTDVRQCITCCNIIADGLSRVRI
jgi:hypothetical protein